ncbi:MAG TPA: LysM peptidoglycan-binding domain-containing protein [Polyangiaceae bacterium]|nr:LysM peptidoglycan-binding domain-containing protein [Polyangiaceae bacterium]HPY17929.1 LysM peptidoglycan-binding domain-containing protein [Polyangiaceae bacterium]HQB43740.1 LysM peptidoglycan-binding domain-containing protein [Polyangiaceae bacterium]HQK19559.1 LysM peptidoglycan-binding domain-containing protein [Polyangiaceae bacterium]
MKALRSRANVWLVMVMRRVVLWLAPLVAVVLFVTDSMAQAPCATHTVGEGQSLWKIAKRYHVTVEALREQNGMVAGAPIKPGQVLEIPARKGSCKSAKGAASRPTAPTPKAASPTPEAKTETSKASNPQPVIAPPAAWTQTQKSAQERGVNPCNTPDPGFGIYDRWDRSPSMGQMISVQKGGITRSGQFDVMFHFHGHEAVRKEWVQVMDGAVLVGIDLGIGSGPYESVFRSPNVFQNLVRSVEAAVAKKTGNPKAKARKIGLSAWSAGYGAVGEILRTAYGKQVVDTVVLLDGLHCGYAGKSLNAVQLEPFVEFAKRSAKGQKLMFVSHSSIIPPGYASTTETANYLIHALNGRAQAVRPRGSDPMGLDLISRYDRAGFHVRGYQGNDKMDHCAHIGLLRDILRVHVKRRWQSPKGRKA